MTPEQTRTLLDDLDDLVSALKDAEPDHKFEVYRALQQADLRAGNRDGAGLCSSRPAP
jgi:hypothetical protein